MTAVVVALAIGAAGSLAARALAWRVGLVARPNPIVPQHVRPIAYLGGAGIACGVVAAALIGGIEMRLLLGALAFWALGTYDDARPLRPLPKLVAQVAIAAAYDPAGAVWIVVVVNAVNLTDVCDGLVASLAIAALVVVAIVQPAAFPLVVAAACAGFWPLNRPPASMFLGDGGSHLLGFAIAAAWLDVARAAPAWNVVVAALLGCGVFLLELGFLVIVRHRRGLPVWRGSPDHLALRLQAAGLSKARTVAVALVAAVTFGALAVWLAREPRVAVLGIAAIATACVLVAQLYAREPVPKAGRAREDAS